MIYSITFIIPYTFIIPCTQSLSIYLEFIQHHLLLGVSHIFLSAPFSWNGTIMNQLQRILRSFIEEGTVSITSHSDDDIDYLYSVRGLSFHRDVIKVLQVHSISNIFLFFIVIFFSFFFYFYFFFSHTHTLTYTHTHSPGEPLHLLL